MARPTSVVILIGSLLLGSGCNRSNPSPASAPALATVTVEATKVQLSAFTSYRELPGTVRAVERATVAAKTLGTVASTDLVIGQPVTAGDVLLTLTADEMEARVDQARAALNLVKRDHAREAGLLAQGATAAELVRSLEDQQRIAVATLALAEAQLAYTRVTAPFDGVITARLVEPGDLAAPGTGLFAIEGTRHFEVEVAVPDSLPVPEIDTSISMVLGGRLITGHLHEASPAANPASRTRLARIRLPAETVNRSGHYAKVRWPDQTGDQITVPSTAVTAFGQMKRVFVVAGNQAQLRLVRTGAKRDGRTIVLAGLNPDETIIIVPPTGLRDGQPLQLTP